MERPKIGKGSEKQRQIIREQQEKLKGSCEQGDLKNGVANIGKKERASKNRKEQGAQVKMLQGAESIDPSHITSNVALSHFNNIANFRAH